MVRIKVNIKRFARTKLVKYKKINHLFVLLFNDYKCN